MYLRRVSWVDGWNVLLGLIHENAVHFLLYLLLQIVLTFVIGFLVLIAVLCTCCLGGLLLLIPFAGAVVLLPISVFKRSYPLYYLAQYGSEFDLFQPPD